MITLEHGPNFISAAVFGEFTVADYNEFKELASYKIRFEGPIRLLIDLRQMLGYTVDVAWEDLQFTRAHRRDFSRIAILTASEWITWNAWARQLFTNAEVMVFEDEDPARDWLLAPAESAS